MKMMNRLFGVHIMTKMQMKTQFCGINGGLNMENIWLYEVLGESWGIVKAKSRKEAEEKVSYEIQEVKLDPPENCSDSWCEVEEIK